MHIDLRQLRHYIALVEHRSFVAAAAAVNLSQSAFSRSIQTLEHNVGCRLVDRASKELAPTRQGLLVLEHSRRLVHGAHNLVNEITSSMAPPRAWCASAPGRRRPVGWCPGRWRASSPNTRRRAPASRWTTGRR
jgi:DNA-binding transcriptional LysR family regulator